MSSVKLDADRFPPFSKVPTRISAQPYLAMINIALFEEYARLLEENDVAVVLTGEGGDAVLFGDGPEPFFFADFVRRGNVIGLAREIGRWSKSGRKHRPARYWLEKCALQPFKDWQRKHLIQDYSQKVPWLSDGHPLLKARNGIKRGSWVSPDRSVGDYWYLERVFRCANVVSFWDHRASMRAEFRHPLMNISLINFMRSIPWDVKLSPLCDRYLQRKAFCKILPEVIIKRNTKGSPDPAIYAGFEASTVWERLLTEKPNLVVRGYVKESEWHQAVQFAKLGQCECIKQFKAAAVLELWLRLLCNGIEN